MHSPETSITIVFEENKPGLEYCQPAADTYEDYDSNF